MSEEKQIEEMAHDLCGRCRDGVCLVDDRPCNLNCTCHINATTLYEAGYRKQSEGEWVKEWNHMECSNCHYRAPYKKIKAGYHLQDLTAYCPNCGAKMGGGE